MIKRIRHSVVAAALILAVLGGCGDDTPQDVQGPSPVDDVDTTPPQPVTDLTITYRPGSQDALFEWTAPRDDARSSQVALYDIRYSYSLPLDWERAITASNPPPPGDEGSAESFVLPNVIRGRDLFAAIRTYDAVGNASTIGPVTHLAVPGISFDVVCTDVLTGAPVAGLDVIISSNALTSLVTDADGRAHIDDVGEGTVAVRVGTGVGTIAYHTFDDDLQVDDDIVLDVPMIPVQTPASAAYDNVLQILIDALVVGGGEKVVKRWSTYPIQWAAPEFTNINGLDYTSLTRAAAAQWNARVGTPVFEEVPSSPAVGVHFEYLPRSAMGIQNGITSYGNDASGYPLHDRIRIVDDFSDQTKLYAILMHELGHTIRLSHLPAGFIMFGGQPLPDDITDDEVLTVHLLMAMPNGTNLDKYDASTPAP